MKNLLGLIPLIIFLFLAPPATIQAQSGQIRGQVLDQQSEMPLPGASIRILDSDPLIGTIADSNGDFLLGKIPVGRYVIRVSFLGFESATIPNIVVGSGKDVVLNLSLRESINELDIVEVVAQTPKDEAQNEMAKVSARQFSVEEVNRYSGGRSDVARLASNFAGVSVPDDSRNDIIIRGNSPTGVLWRLEGIPIPNPNHFSTLGTTGGPVSALNPNMLQNSDFLTSAFPAEYGNAIAGVFDLKFRKGNRSRTEGTFQLAAFSGLEAMVEGPLGNSGSYLLAGRYSFIGIVGAGGTTATPNYQDLAINIDFGQAKFGRFSIFGIGGNSDILFIGDEIAEDDLFSNKDEDLLAKSNFGVLGLQHNMILGENTFWRSILAATVVGNDFQVDRNFNAGTADEVTTRYGELKNSEQRLSFSSSINSKLSNRSTLRVGILAEQYMGDNYFRDRGLQPDEDGDGTPDWFTVYDFDGSFGLFQPFGQIQYRVSEDLELGLGIHSQYSSLNEQFVLEPRASISYSLNHTNTLKLGYGMHNQMAPLPVILLVPEESSTTSNRELDFVKSQHFVLAHDAKLAEDWRLKSEVYYQKIENAPVDRILSGYSVLTEGADFGFSQDKNNLVSEGSGFNRGIEITLEKFFSDGYHMLSTASLYESKYEGSDGIERNSPFDNNYVFNVLAGKEFNFGKNGRNAFIIDTKLTTAGGRWYSPINLERSRELGFEILDQENPFSQQYSGYFRWDLKLGFKINSSKRRMSHSIYFDFQNLTNNKNIFERRYNRLSGEIQEIDQIGFFPDFQYRIQF